jgi:hypothetical protein
MEITKIVRWEDKDLIVLGKDGREYRLVNCVVSDYERINDGLSEALSEDTVVTKVKLEWIDIKKDLGEPFN